MSKWAQPSLNCIGCSKNNLVTVNGTETKLLNAITYAAELWWPLTSRQASDMCQRKIPFGIPFHVKGHPKNPKNCNGAKKYQNMVWPSRPLESICLFDFILGRQSTHLSGRSRWETATWILPRGRKDMYRLLPCCTYIPHTVEKERKKEYVVNMLHITSLQYGYVHIIVIVQTTICIKGSQLDAFSP